MKKTFSGISKIHWFSGFLLSLLLLVWIVYPQWFSNHLFEVVDVTFDPACDLRAGPCQTMLENGGLVSFAIEPRAIPVSENLQLEVTVTGIDADVVSVDINGVDMKMPANVVKLQQIKKGLFKGDSTLSYCTRNAMEWESVVQVEAGKQQIKVPFRFITSQ